MDQFTFVIPTLLGVEGLTADELRRMNMQQVRAENGRLLPGYHGGHSPAEPPASDRRTGLDFSGHLPSPFF